MAFQLHPHEEVFGTKKKFLKQLDNKSRALVTRQLRAVGFSDVIAFWVPISQKIDAVGSVTGCQGSKTQHTERKNTEISVSLFLETTCVKVKGDRDHVTWLYAWPIGATERVVPDSFSRLSSFPTASPLSALPKMAVWGLWKCRLCV